MLKKVHINPPTVKVYHGDSFLGIFNEYELNDLRIRIMQSKAEGYEVEDEHGVRFVIDNQGRLPVWPKCFDIFTNQLTTLLMNEGW